MAKINYCDLIGEKFVCMNRLWYSYTLEFTLESVYDLRNGSMVILSDAKGEEVHFQMSKFKKNFSPASN